MITRLIVSLLAVVTIPALAEEPVELEALERQGLDPPDQTPLFVSR